MLTRLALVLAALFWAGNFIAGRYIADEISPVMLNSLRWITALIFLMLFTSGRLLEIIRLIRMHPGWFAVMGLCGVVYHVLVYTALGLTTATNLALIIGATPAMILLMSVYGEGERPTLQRVVIVCLGFAGIIVLIQGHLALPNRGDLLACVALGMWAYYNVCLKRCPVETDGLLLTTAITLLGVLFMLPLAAVETALNGVMLSDLVILVILYVGIFASGIAFLLWNRGVMAIGPIKAGQFMNLVPVFGVLLGILLLKEPFSTRHVLAAVLILSSLVLSELYGRRETVIETTALSARKGRKTIHD